MENAEKSTKTCKTGPDGFHEKNGHLKFTDPSPWVGRFAPLMRQDAPVLDLACGGGRHTAHLLGLGYRVVAVDKNTTPIKENLGDRPGLTIIETDLEGGKPPFGPGGALHGQKFAGIIVSNYLWRALFDGILGALADNGVLIYETFALGNEVLSRPRNPDHLLRPGELLDQLSGRLQVIAYETGVMGNEAPAGVKQRVVGVNNLTTSHRSDGQPDPVALP